MERKVEKRRHKRIELSCPLKICNNDGQVLAETNTVNISDSGALVYLPAEQAGAFNCKVHLHFSIPRRTQDSQIFEEFGCNGKIVRRAAGLYEKSAAVAMEFENPLQLTLEA